MTTLGGLLRNSLYNSGTWLVAVVAGILAPPLLVGHLSTQGYGLYVLLLSLIGYHTILDLGLGQGVTKFVAAHRAREDWQSVNDVINASLAINFILAGCIGLLLALFAGPLLRMVSTPEEMWGEAQRSLIIVAGGFPCAMLAATLASALKGLQRYDLSSKITIGVNVLLNISLITAIYVDAGLVWLIGLTVLSHVLSLGISLVVLGRFLPSWRVSLGISGHQMRPLFSFSGYLFLTQIAHAFARYMVGFVIAYFLGMAAVTYYDLPVKLLGVTGGLLGSVFAVVFPYASEVGARQDHRKVQELYIEGSRAFAVIAAPMLLFTFLFSYELLALWVGPAIAEQSWMVLRLLSFSVLVASLTTVPNLIVMGLGHSRVVGLFSIATTLCYLAVLIPLTRSMGVAGAAMGMLIGNIPGIVLLGYLTTRIVRVDLYSYIKAVLGIHLPFLAGAWVLVWLLGGEAITTGLMLMVKFAFFGIYAGVLFVTNLPYVFRVVSSFQGR